MSGFLFKKINKMKAQPCNLRAVIPTACVSSALLVPSRKVEDDGDNRSWFESHDAALCCGLYKKLVFFLVLILMTQNITFQKHKNLVRN